MENLEVEELRSGEVRNGVLGRKRMIYVEEKGANMKAKRRDEGRNGR